MLRELHIKNFALIDSLSIEFDSCLNVLTGETGAGKSILIDAIRFVLGERVDGQPAREPAKPAAAEAVFDIQSKTLRAHPRIAEVFGEEDEVLVLRREYQEGRSRCQVNGRTVNVSVLKDLGSLLLDIHGQYDHQLLFELSSQLELVDDLGKAAPMRADYKALFDEYEGLRTRREELSRLEAGREREVDLLKYQIDEIEKAGISDAGEEQSLEEERIRLANSEKLHELAALLLDLLNEDPRSASSLMGRAGRDFGELARIDATLSGLKGEFETVQLGLEEIIRGIEEYRENLSYDPDRLKEIERRLDVLELMKRKYGPSLEKVTRFLAEAKIRYDELVNSSVYMKDVEKKIDQALPRLKTAADQITEKRKKTGQSLKKIIETELKDLGIANARFQCEVKAGELTATGQDQLEFLISLNPGQDLQPLRKIISGGEVSRVMLALKKALMKVDPVPSLIFDEIDANIGGRLGSVTGEKLKEISRERQVLLITHLPQIASFADRHFKVSKKVVQGKTLTHYELIQGDARVKELAQMMSGQKETELSRKHAEEMLSRVSR